MISSYKAAQLHMEKARSKAKGRPMKGNGWRLFQDGNEYVVTAYDVWVGRFLPDNTFMFTMTGERAHRVAHTLSATMHRNLPFHWARCGHMAYRVDHEANLPDRYPWEHFKRPTNAPQVYDGLKFDLCTGKCLNPRIDYKRNVDPDRRKVWLAAVRKWKRKLKAAARVGVFDGLIAQEEACPTTWVDKPRWTQKEYLDILYTAIKNEDCGTDLLRMFVASGTLSWSTPTSMEIYDHIDRVVKAQSVGLRERFGVFKGEE